MDRIEEIRQHCETGGPIRRIDMKYLLSEVDRLRKEKQDEFDIASSYFRSWQKATARAEAAEAERDRAIKQMCRFCKSLDKKAGIKPVCAADCEWRGQQAGKGE